MTLTVLKLPTFKGAPFTVPHFGCLASKLASHSSQMLRRRCRRVCRRRPKRQDLQCMPIQVMGFFVGHPIIDFLHMKFFYLKMIFDYIDMMFTLLF